MLNDYLTVSKLLMGDDSQSAMCNIEEIRHKCRLTSNFISMTRFCLVIFVTVGEKTLMNWKLFRGGFESNEIIFERES